MNSRTTHTKRRPGRPSGGRLIADRTQLLEAAERIIEARGTDVTMEEIAAEASVTKPILYRTVGDREALVGALAERFVQRVNEAAAAAMAHAASRRDAVKRLLLAFIETVAEHQNLFLFVAVGATGKDRLAEQLGVADLSAGPLAEQLAILHGGDPAEGGTASLIWAHAMIGALQFAMCWWLRDRTCTTDELAEDLAQLFWSGIAPGGRPGVGHAGEAPAPK